MNTYMLGSREFQPIIITKVANGAIFNMTSNVEYVIVPKGQPTDVGTWAECDMLDGQAGFYTDQLTVGFWTVYVRLTDVTESPIARAGFVRIK